MTELISKLSDKKIFSSTEQVIADYILKNFREVANLSTRQLAKETFTSSAAIVRFSQKLGFSGYAEFKTKFLSEMLESLGEPKNRFITAKDSIGDIVEKVVTIEIAALKDSYDKIKINPFVRAANYLSQADYIDFYAMNMNLNLARMASESFIVAGKYCSVPVSTAEQYLQAYKVPKNHLAVLISRTGENGFLINIAKILNEQKTPILLITTSAKSTLGNLSQVVFETAATDKMEELGPRVFLTGAKYVIDVLFGILMARTDYFEAKKKEEWLKSYLHY